MRTMVDRLMATDQRLLDRLGGVESGVLDHALPRLGVAANYGRLWMGVAALLVLTGRPDARRAAVRGLASQALASGVANVVAKGAVRRVRPTTDRLPAVRLLRRAPVTTSFPSGHSASAAAFATGAALEMPALAVPLGCLAVAVAVSRVVTGAHYPSDVVTGVALGAGAASLTLRWRPGAAGRDAGERGQVAAGEGGVAPRPAGSRRIPGQSDPQRAGQGHEPQRRGEGQRLAVQTDRHRPSRRVHLEVGAGPLQHAAESAHPGGDDAEPAGVQLRPAAARARRASRYGLLETSTSGAPVWRRASGPSNARSSPPRSVRAGPAASSPTCAPSRRGRRRSAPPARRHPATRC